MAAEKEEAEKRQADRGGDQEERGDYACDGHPRLAFGFDAIAGHVTIGAW